MHELRRGTNEHNNSILGVAKTCFTDVVSSVTLVAGRLSTILEEDAIAA
jgi:hypothetical protein